MKATEFVKNCGIGEAKRVLNDARGCVGVKLYGKYEFSTDDLKRLVESHELVGTYGGLGSAKFYLESKYREISNPKTHAILKQAIADVEACKES